MSDLRPQACLTLGAVAFLGVIMLFGAGDETSAGPDIVRAVKQSPPNGARKALPVRLINAAPQFSAHTQSDISATIPATPAAEEEPAQILTARPSKAVRFRTWCVRLCDGFYYPMNYLTTRGRLQADDEKCRSSCSSEARLYVNAVVGRKAAPLMDLAGRAYVELPTAFAYRRQVNSACTCDGSQMVVTSSRVDHAQD